MRWHRRVHPIALNVFLVGLLLFSAAQLMSPTRYDVDAGTLEVTVTPSVPGGRLRLPLGPFGELTWRTHRAPLNVEANFILARKAKTFPSPDEFDGLPAAMVRSTLPWLFLVALSAGILIGEGSRRARVAVGSLAGATLLLAGFGAGVASAATFNADALADPRYRGPIEDAPRVLSLIKEIRRDLPGTRRNITRVVAGLQRLHADVLARRTIPAGDTTTFLVISDIHNNPLGLLIARQMVEQFGVDAVLNAGDFTDRGTAPEGELFASLGSFGVPQVVAPGNHEDGAALARIARLPNVTVFPRAVRRDATGEEAEDAFVASLGTTVAGVGIVGAADLNAGSVASAPVDDVLIDEVLCANMRTARAERKATVVLVHDRRYGDCIGEQAIADNEPLLFVYGHDHKQRFERIGPVVFVNPGTSGANGPKSATEGDYGFALVEMDRATKLPSSVCLFSFEGPEKPKEVSCHLLDEQVVSTITTPTPTS